jgi:chromosome segregation ATPase
MALGDKVEELQKAVAALIERLDSTVKSLDFLTEAHRESVRELANLRREQEKETALLRREIEALNKWKDELKDESRERGRRVWAFGPNVVGALISGLIAAAVAYFVASR